jgi:protein gp37
LNRATCLANPTSGGSEMAENSKIEWTDHTFNPWIGCTKVSPACDGCYAENLMSNRYGRVQWGPGEDRQRTGKANWRKPVAWDKAAKEAGTRRYVFCASLADVFDNEVDEMWRADLFTLIAATPNLIWLLLTKRIGNVMKMTDPMRGNPMLPTNAAIGATIANQPEYDRDRMKLWEVKEALRPLFTFGSFEPLLGRVVLDKYAPDWIITGGETDQGPHKARYTVPDDFRYLRDQSIALGRAFFMKQMTRKAPIPADLLVRQYPEAA